jgi:TatD DNase family protein
VVHSREANEDTINIIKEYSDVKFLFHSWSGTVEQTKELNEWGNVWFSYNGIITFKNAESVREAFLATRKDRVLLETDCPYLTPVPFRGKTNYPKYVEYVYNYVNELDGTTEEQIDSNVKEFFNV